MDSNKFSFKQSFIDISVDVDVASDWMIVRKNGKAANTKTAFNSFKAQVEKSGKSANECVKLCVIKSWKGFNASWLANVDDFEMSEHKQLVPKLRYATTQDLLPEFGNEQAIIEKQKENTYVCNGDGKIFPLRNRDGSRNREGDYILGSDKQIYKITI